MPKYSPVEDFPGYRVGTDGSVWTKWERVYVPGFRGSRMAIGKTWRRLQPPPIKGGYLRVSLYSTNGQKRVRRLVQHLVLEAFVGPRPDGMEACHFPDRSPTNNSLNNLRWDSRSSNQNDRISHGTDGRGSKHWNAKIDEVKVLAVRADHATGLYGYRKLSQRHELPIRTVRRIVKRETWKHI